MDLKSVYESKDVWRLLPSCSFVVPSIDVMDLVVSEVLPCISASKAVFFNLVLLKH